MTCWWAPGSKQRTCSDRLNCLGRESLQRPAGKLSRASRKAPAGSFHKHGDGEKAHLLQSQADIPSSADLSPRRRTVKREHCPEAVDDGSLRSSAGRVRAQPALPLFFATVCLQGLRNSPGLRERRSESQRASCKAQTQQHLAHISCLRGLKAQGPRLWVVPSSTGSQEQQVCRALEEWRTSLVMLLRSRINGSGANPGTSALCHLLRALCSRSGESEYKTRKRKALRQPNRHKTFPCIMINLAEGAGTSATASQSSASSPLGNRGQLWPFTFRRTKVKEEQVRRRLKGLGDQIWQSKD